MTADQQAIDEREANARLAYGYLFRENARRGDALLVLGHLAIEAGFYQVPSIAQWIKDTGSAAGFEAFCAEQNGRRSLFAHITRFASLNEAEMLKLERIARFGFAEE